MEVRVAVDGPEAANDLVPLVLDTALAVSGVLREPPPACPMTAAAPTEVVLRLLLWHDPESALDVCPRVTAALSVALDGAASGTPSRGRRRRRPHSHWAPPEQLVAYTALTLVDRID